MKIYGLKFVVLNIFLSACSNQEIYETIQSDRLRECEKLHNGVREECIAAHETSYEQYKRERDAVLKK